MPHMIATMSSQLMRMIVGGGLHTKRRQNSLQRGIAHGTQIVFIVEILVRDTVCGSKIFKTISENRGVRGEHGDVSSLFAWVYRRQVATR